MSSKRDSRQDNHPFYENAVILEYDGASSKNSERWLKTTSEQLILKYNYAGMFTTHPDGNWVQSPFPTPPRIEQAPATADATAVGTFNYFNNPDDPDASVVIRNEEREYHLESYKLLLREAVKASASDQSRKPEIVRAILSCISPTARSHLERQTGYNDCVVISPDPCKLWKMIKSVFQHVDTGVKEEDLITWVVRLFGTRQRQSETLSALKDRITSEINNFNAFLAASKIDGFTQVSPKIAAGIFVRALDPTFNEPRKCILNNAVMGLADYPSTIDAAFETVSKWRVAKTTKIDGDTVTHYGVALLSSAAPKKPHKDYKGKDKGKKGKQESKQEGKEVKDGKTKKDDHANDGKLRHRKSGELVVCDVGAPNDKCGGNHFRRDCPKLKKAIDELSNDEMNLVSIENVLALGPGQLGPRAVLLDNQCSLNASIVCDPALLTNIRPCDPVHVSGVGSRTFDQQGDTNHFGSVL